MDARIYSSEMLDSLRLHLESASSKYITYPKFIFLCGKAYDASEYSRTNRGIVDEYFRKQSENVFTVLSEALWEDGFAPDIDLLSFEEFLAEVSDDIILFVESPGAYCELGAFAYADRLFGKKLTIVNDIRYASSQSFIVRGPTEKAKKGGATVIYAPLDGKGLLSCEELRDHIRQKVDEFNIKNSVCNKKNINTDKNGVLLYPFIIEILELIKLLQPIEKSDLISVYKAVKGFDSFKFVKSDRSEFHGDIKPDHIYKLLKTVDLIRYSNGRIQAGDETRSQSFMFKYRGFSEDRERNRLICRKYRYGENVCIR